MFPTASRLKKLMKPIPRHVLQSIEPALKHWPRTANGFFLEARRLMACFCLRGPHIIAIGQINCESQIGATENGKRHSCRQQFGLRVEELKSPNEQKSNAGNRQPPW